MKATQFAPLTSLIPCDNRPNSFLYDRIHVAFSLPLIRCRCSSSSRMEEFSTALHFLSVVSACLEGVACR